MATRTQSTVVAVFRNRSEAEAAASDLKSNGFGPNDIFLSSDSSAVDPNAQTGGTEHHHEGGIVGWFKSVFGAEDTDDRSYYENAANSGHSFLSVDVTDQNVDQAANILNSHNPVDIHREQGSPTGSTGASQTSATSGARTAPPVSGAGAARSGRTAGDNEAIPVVQEELKVGKRAVLKGGVRVYSRVVDTPVQETVRLREEQVRVDRTPVNREATAADLRPGQEQVFEVKEYAEEAVVSKQARVVEEVRVHKEATEHDQTIRENVRRTEVQVENVGAGNTGKAGSSAGRAAGAATSSPTPSIAGTGASGTTGGTALGANEEDFRRDYASRYGNSGESFDTYSPAYSYGYQMANDPRYRGRSFDDVESDLRNDYGRRYPNSTWERMKDSIRYGWNKVTSKV